MATGEARMPDAASLPPRRALPRDVEVPVLPGLGRTWYDRDGRYWARRAGLTVMWAVALLLIVLIDVGIFTSIRHSSQAAFAILLTADVVLAVAVLGYFAVRTVRRWNTPSLPGRARAARRAKRGRAAGFLSGLAQIGYVLAVLAAAVVFLFCPALILALFLMSLLPEPLPERQARLWMAERLGDHGYGTPAG
jgi:membrane protein YqaA with SNARE-associated domain